MTSTAIAVPAAPSPAAVERFNPFALMDQLDSDAFQRQLEGVVSDEVTALVYVVKENGKERTALSKDGVDQSCLALRQSGMVIREVEVSYVRTGSGDNEEAMFTARAAIFVFGEQGQEVKLDEVIGVKREPLYRHRAPLTLDSKCPGKKPAGKTWRQMMEADRSYVQWIANNFSDPGVKEFAQRLVDGEAVDEFAIAAEPNPFWFEHGAMKALRNARMRLLPQKVIAATIALAKAEGRARVVAEEGRPVMEQPAPEPQKVPPPTDVDFQNFRVLRGRDYWTEAERLHWDELADAAKEDVFRFRELVDGMKLIGSQRKSGKSAHVVQDPLPPRNTGPVPPLQPVPLEDMEPVPEREQGFPAGQTETADQPKARKMTHADGSFDGLPPVLEEPIADDLPF